MNRVLYCVEERRLHGSIAVGSAFEGIDEWKEDLLLFLHMHEHLSSDIAEQLLDLAQLAVFASVFFPNLCQQRAQAWNRVANILVMALADVLGQFGQWRGYPPGLAGGHQRTVLPQLP